MSIPLTPKGRLVLPTFLREERRFERPAALSAPYKVSASLSFTEGEQVKDAYRRLYATWRGRALEMQAKALGFGVCGRQAARKHRKAGDFVRKLHGHRYAWWPKSRQLPKSLWWVPS